MSAAPTPTTECMDECGSIAQWRSDDGYPFCNPCGHLIHVEECKLENALPMTYSAWLASGRPHGPAADA